MMRVDRARVHQRDQVQALQDQLPHPLVAVTTDPLLIGTGIRGGAGIGQEDSSRVLVPGVLVALDFTPPLREITPSVGFATVIIWVSVSRAPPVVLSVDRRVIMRGSARIEPLRVNPLVEAMTENWLSLSELVLVRLQDKPNRTATSVVGPQVRLEFTP